jgi:hypothetical protein
MSKSFMQRSGRSNFISYQNCFFIQTGQRTVEVFHMTTSYIAVRLRLPKGYNSGQLYSVLAKFIS